ncbi:unnamed protein product, partial [Sphacelaria rigidula]
YGAALCYSVRHSTAFYFVAVYCEVLCRVHFHVFGITMCTSILYCNVFCCPSHNANAGAVLEYWMGRMAVSMPAIEFCGRGWNTANEHRGERLTKTNIVVNLSDHAYIDPAGKTQRLLCRCNPVASEKHRCKRSCTCARLRKDCHPFLCGCEGRCLPPAPETRGSPPERLPGKGLPTSGQSAEGLSAEGLLREGLLAEVTGVG